MNDETVRDLLRDRLIRFVRDVGIEIRAAPLGETCFLPGLAVCRGAILVDQTRWLYPGDLLHEAGHLAVATPEEREAETLSPSGGDEMAAIAWSYAAAVYLNVASAVVFHAEGYRGGSTALAENFAAGRYIGVPLLQYYGMTIAPRQAAPRGAAPYPHMLRWLR